MNLIKTISNILIILSFVVFVPIALHADYDGEFKTFPIPVEVEGEIVPTACYLTLKVYEFNAPASVAFSNLQKKSPELVAKKILDAIKANDPTAFKNASISEEQAHIDARFGMYRKVLEGVDDPRIVRRFDLGAMSYFVIDIGSDQFPVVPLLILKQGDRYLQGFWAITHPVCQNVSSLARAISTMPDDFHSVSAPEYNTEIALMPLFGESTVNPVFFRYTGHRVRYPVFSKTSLNTKYPESLGPLLDFYKKANESLTSENKEQHFEFYGSKSSAKIAGFFDKLKAKNVLGNHLELRTSYRQVYYVIWSEGLSILFHRSQYSDQIVSSGLKYDMVYKYPNNEMKLVNYFMLGALDSLLIWPVFCDKFVDAIKAADSEVKVVGKI
jgi:hypothetical protein